MFVDAVEHLGQREVDCLVGAAVAHPEAWQALAAEHAQEWLCSPRACAVASVVHRKLCFQAPFSGVLSRNFRECAALLDAGQPWCPLLDATLVHRRTEFAEGVVASLQERAALLSRKEWALLAVCHFPWLVFALAALVHEVYAAQALPHVEPEEEEARKKRREAALWFVAFAHVEPVASELSGAFARVLERRVEALCRAATQAGASAEALVEHTEGTALPRYLLVLAAAVLATKPTSMVSAATALQKPIEGVLALLVATRLHGVD